MVEDVPTESPNFRPNKKTVLLNRALLNAFERFKSKKDLDEGNALLIVFAEGLHSLGVLSGVRYERTIAKYDISTLQKEDQEFLEEKQKREKAEKEFTEKQKQELEKKIELERNARFRKWLDSNKGEYEKMTKEQKLEVFAKLEEEVRKELEGEKQQ